MKTNHFSLILLLCCLEVSAQPLQKEYSILFYNVENLFDVKNDSLSNDDAFTPEGDRRWTYNRMEKKILDISKVIISSCGWDTPTLVALCEIENRYVIERLQQSEHLHQIPYRIIHKESPDHRGIDIGLLYNTTLFNPLKYEYYPLIDNSGEVLKSREIMYVSGELGKDTIHLFVNHWPSRYSGVLETKETRITAAKLLKEKVLQLQAHEPKAKIVLIGDFNDNPDNDSMSAYLEASRPEDSIGKHKLYNLSYEWNSSKSGTLKYRSQWFVFDQVIVSGTLLASNSGLSVEVEGARIFHPQFLVESDKVYGGIKPFRTYSGYKYNGGFSDHFPIVLKLQSN